MLHICDFEHWCPLCTHKDVDEAKDPCHDCLNEPVNDDSRKPVMWEEAKQ